MEPNQNLDKHGIAAWETVCCSLLCAPLSGLWASSRRALQGKEQAVVKPDVPLGEAGHPAAASIIHGCFLDDLWEVQLHTCFSRWNPSVTNTKGLRLVSSYHECARALRINGYRPPMVGLESLLFGSFQFKLDFVYEN